MVTSGLGDSRRSSRSLTSRLHPAVLHRHVQHEWPVQILHLADVVLDIGAVIGNRAIDVGATAHQVAQLAAQAVADRPHLAVAFLERRKMVPGILHVAHGEVVVEFVVEVERLLDVLGIASESSTPGSCRQNRSGTRQMKPASRKFVCMMAHGVVDAPDLHDGDDGAAGRAVGMAI